MALNAYPEAQTSVDVSNMSVACVAVSDFISRAKTLSSSKRTPTINPYENSHDSNMNPYKGVMSRVFRGLRWTVLLGISLVLLDFRMQLDRGG